MGLGLVRAVSVIRLGWERGGFIGQDYAGLRFFDLGAVGIEGDSMRFFG